MVTLFRHSGVCRVCQVGSWWCMCVGGGGGEETCILMRTLQVYCSCIKVARPPP